jgi:tetratricopeptide (TPR) repeat protein
MAEQTDSRREVSDIFNLIHSGQNENALEQCSVYLAKRPDDINILGLQGALLLKLGRISGAKPVLEKAIRLEPAFAKPHEDLGMLYLSEDDPTQAVRYFEEAVRLDGSQPSAYSGLAEGLSRLGRTEAANEAKQIYVRLSSVGLALAQANELLKAGNTSDAEQICEKTLKQHPTNTDILRMLARIASVDGRHVIAEGLLRRIVTLSPENYKSHLDLARFFGERSRIPEAVETLEKAVELSPNVVSIHHKLGAYRAGLGKTDQALSSYDKALQLQPDYPPALAGRGHMLRILGQQEEAVLAYEACTVAGPDYGDAWWSLANFKGYCFSTEQVDVMRDLISSAPLDDHSRIGILFALARSFEDKQEFDSAWENYDAANALKRKQVAYDPVETEVQHNSIAEVFNRKLFELKSSPATDGPAPIFIVGMPRSGSTLLEQILASHSTVEGCGELPFIVMLSRALGGPTSGAKKYPHVIRDMSADQIASIGKAYLHYSRANRPMDLPRFTDKLPENFTHIGLIHLALPNAKFIDARRHPVGTCIGNYRYLFAQGKTQTYDLNEFAEYYLQYDRLMAHWNKVLPGRILTVQYEDVVADVEQQARRMLDFCELDWEDSSLNFFESDRPVGTASSEQVRLPVYADAVNFWKNYESKLGDIKNILAPVLPD